MVKKGYLITAMYQYRYKTRKEAEASKRKLPKLKNAVFTAITRYKNGYGFSAKVYFKADNAASRDEGIKKLKSMTPNAKVTSRAM
jgi:hypothetical protein